MSVDTLDTIQQKLIRFLEEEILVDKEQSRIAPGESLFSGILDSLGTLRLVVFIEETYGIQVADGELIPENFDTVERLAKYIQTKTAGA
jgi:acyl carrier protein